MAAKWKPPPPNGPPPPGVPLKPPPPPASAVASSTPFKPPPLPITSTAPPSVTLHVPMQPTVGLSSEPVFSNGTADFPSFSSIENHMGRGRGTIHTETADRGRGGGRGATVRGRGMTRGIGRGRGMPPPLSSTIVSLFSAPPSASFSSSDPPSAVDTFFGSSSPVPFGTSPFPVLEDDHYSSDSDISDDGTYNPFARGAKWEADPVAAHPFAPFPLPVAPSCSSSLTTFVRPSSAAASSSSVSHTSSSAHSYTKPASCHPSTSSLMPALSAAPQLPLGSVSSSSSFPTSSAPRRSSSGAVSSLPSTTLDRSFQSSFAPARALPEAVSLASHSTTQHTVAPTLPVAVIKPVTTIAPSSIQAPLNSVLPVASAVTTLPASVPSRPPPPVVSATATPASPLMQCPSPLCGALNVPSSSSCQACGFTLLPVSASVNANGGVVEETPGKVKKHKTEEEKLAKRQRKAERLEKKAKKKSDRREARSKTQELETSTPSLQQFQEQPRTVPKIPFGVPVYAAVPPANAAPASISKAVTRPAEASKLPVSTKGSEWSCPRCTLINRDLPVCSACQYKRPLGVWVCKACTFANTKETSLVCEVCRLPR